MPVVAGSKSCQFQGNSFCTMKQAVAGVYYSTVMEHLLYVFPGNQGASVFRQKGFI